ncbi:MAG: hypothetical protein LBQ56_04965 [Synergistaceae bacterium]|nr:hypothetical protein [Synergistaceae bacterium]
MPVKDLKPCRKKRKFRAAPGFSIVEAFMASMLTASVMLGVMTMVSVTTRADERVRVESLQFLNLSSVAAEINSGAAADSFEGILGLSGNVEPEPESAPCAIARHRVFVSEGAARLGFGWTLWKIGGA